MKDKVERLLARLNAPQDSHERLWRHPLAVATMTLLAKGEPVTVDSLIALLHEGLPGADPVIRKRALEEAIERLRELRIVQDGGDDRDG